MFEKRLSPNESRNENLSFELKMKMINSIGLSIEEILQTLGYDRNDSNLVGTPDRVAKMFVTEIFSGCFTKEPKITTFPNTKNVNQMISLGPITVKSMCSHHFLPFMGEAYISYIPKSSSDKGRVFGISKLARIVDWYSRRPQIQEELTEQIAHYIEENINPEGVGVHITAKHLCMCIRGAEEPNSFMDTTALRGSFLGNDSTKAEFLNMLSMKRK